MPSSNPFFKEERFIHSTSDPTAAAGVMTVEGTANKTAILLAITTVAAGAGWILTLTNPAIALPGLIATAIVAFVIAMVVSFKPTTAPVAAPVYALVEGACLGILSSVLERLYPGIAASAMTMTLGIFFTMLVLYRTKVLRATPTFTKVVIGCTFGICIAYLFSFVLGFFGTRMPFLHDSTPVGIGISIFILIVAALNFILDFDFIDEGARRGLPKDMEWYAAFGLLVTLAWVYIESLRLLRKLQR